MTWASPVTRSFTVRGEVQGVGFRWYARETAARCDVSGWISNTADGSVTGEVGGDPPAVEAFLQAMASGPPAARVDDIVTGTGDSSDLPSPFEIRR